MVRRIVVAVIVLLMATNCFAEMKVSTGYDNRVMFYGIPVASDVFRQAVEFQDGGVDLSAAWLNPKDDDEDFERYDLAAGYTWQIGDIAIRAGFGWFMYSELDADNGFDVQAISATVRHVSGLMYTVAHLYPTNGSSATEAGQVHILGIDRDVGPVKLFGDVVYNDEFSPFGGPRIDDFSHARSGAMLTVPIGQVDFLGTYYHQWAMNDVLDDEDVFGLSIALRF